MSALADILKEEHERVLERWALRTRPSAGVREAVAQLLTALGASLRAGQVQPALLEAAREHGRRSPHLDALARDYGLLRDGLLDRVEESSRPMTLAEVRVLTDLVDRALAEGAAAHAR
ncbi:hypothetical protein FGE12_27140 [Aggregicoccus sp. 17bor-14]|uniref:hypothetical protein n=1 Tax=Myxococcaceae TaxID=31 RepID=UPI00129C7918|nr:MULTISPECIES: hypothetical protein [Myxococcaceae]MBF5046120.1 hypothetical protein [Simulacricoccus sp. 17bor-14]MRI91847.1 hypothetical protein [Aggregicoccus sp. 17bor-14]